MVVQDACYLFWILITYVIRCESRFLSQSYKQGNIGKRHSNNVKKKLKTNFGKISGAENTLLP